MVRRGMSSLSSNGRRSERTGTGAASDYHSRPGRMNRWNRSSFRERFSETTREVGPCGARDSSLWRSFCQRQEQVGRRTAKAGFPWRDHSYEGGVPPETRPRSFHDCEGGWEVPRTGCAPCPVDIGAERDRSNSRCPARCRSVVPLETRVSPRGKGIIVKREGSCIRVRWSMTGGGPDTRLRLTAGGSYVMFLGTHPDRFAAGRYCFADRECWERGLESGSRQRPSRRRRNGLRRYDDPR